MRSNEAAFRALEGWAAAQDEGGICAEMWAKDAAAVAAVEEAAAASQNPDAPQNPGARKLLQREQARAVLVCCAVQRGAVLCCLCWSALLCSALLCLRCAALRCAVLRCAALCCAALRCAALCCGQTQLPLWRALLSAAPLRVAAGHLPPAPSRGAPVPPPACLH